MNKHKIFFPLIIMCNFAQPLMAEEKNQSNYTTLQKIGTASAIFAGISVGVGIVSYCNPVPKILPENASIPVCMLTAGVFLATAAGTGGFAGYTLANKLIEKQKENKNKDNKEGPA